MRAAGRCEFCSWSRHTMVSVTRLDCIDRARARGDRRRGRLPRVDGGRGRTARSGADRLPVSEDPDPRDDLATASCLVIHPGSRGDRGPSSLDWAIELGMSDWGVTVLLADGDFDAGDVLATRTFQIARPGRRASTDTRSVRRRSRRSWRGSDDSDDGNRDERRPEPSPSG